MGIKRKQWYYKKKRQIAAALKAKKKEEEDKNPKKSPYQQYLEEHKADIAIAKAEYYAAGGTEENYDAFLTAFLVELKKSRPFVKDSYDPIEKKRFAFFFGVNVKKRYRRGLVTITYNKSNCFIVFTDADYKMIHFISSGAFTLSFNKHDKTLFSHIKVILKDTVRIIQLYKIKNIFLKIYNRRFHKVLVVGIFDVFRNAGIYVRHAKFFRPWAHNGIKRPAVRRKKGHHRKKSNKKRRR